MPDREVYVGRTSRAISRSRDKHGLFGACTPKRHSSSDAVISVGVLNTWADIETHLNGPKHTCT